MSKAGSEIVRPRVDSSCNTSKMIVRPRTLEKRYLYGILDFSLSPRLPILSVPDSQVMFSLGLGDVRGSKTVSFEMQPMLLSLQVLGE